MPFYTSSPPTPFPRYLTPSLPFRRRQSSTDSTNLPDSPLSDSILQHGDDFAIHEQDEDIYLSGHRSHLRCARCLSDLALSSQIISKGFTGRHGRAYLVAPWQSSTAKDTASLRTTKAKNDALPNLPNTFTHKPVPRQLVTGAHTVGDISCSQCGSILGWKYIAAEEESQHYKVGKFILETKRVCRAPTWETDDGLADDFASSTRSALLRRRSSGPAPPDRLPLYSSSALAEVEFDSQDEEECEDLFMGVWTPQLAKKRRKAKLASGQDD